MTYTSLIFALFVIIVFAMYYLVPDRFKWTVLLFASAFFYIYAVKIYSIFILITIISIYFSSIGIERINQETRVTVRANKEIWSKDEKKSYKRGQEKKTKAILIATLVINFGVLFTIKYFGGSLGGLLMPLGISFYTFQSTGYLIDVYRENAEAEKNPFKLALFISFFPQIVQGPIGDFNKLHSELITPHRLTWMNFKYGMELIIWGMFKKLVVADRAVILIRGYLENGGTEKFPHEGPWSGTMALFIILIYSIQLYGDFSGGIDISRGVSRLFGINLAINFRQPYFATTLGDYWRRWHITLGAWMKKYIFFSLAASTPFLNLGLPLSRDRDSRWKTHIGKTIAPALATFIVFIFVGAWHGSNMKYIAFGIWNGLVMMISMLLEPWFIGIREKLHINASSFGHRLFQMARTFILVLIGYYFDVAESLGHAITMMKLTLTDQSISTFITEWQALGLRKLEYIALAFGIFMMLYFDIRLEMTKLETPVDLLERRSGIFQWIIVFLAACAVITFGVYGPGYDAADFVYMQF